MSEVIVPQLSPSDNPDEIWRDIPGYEGLYQVSSLGRVWSKLSYRLMKQQNKNRYYQVSFFEDGTKKKYHVHRLVAMAFLDLRPDQQIDHINGNGKDNRLENLRICTRSQNSFNSKKPRTNSSGLKGVSWDKDVKKWVSKIKYQKRSLTLGWFDNLLEAHQAYCDAARKYAGEFARFE